MGLIIGIGTGLLIAGMIASLQMQSQGVSRQRDAMARSEQYRKEVSERDQRYRQEALEREQRYQQENIIRHEQWVSRSTEGIQLQKDILRTLDEIALQQKETNRILSLLITKARLSNAAAQK